MEHFDRMEADLRESKQKNLAEVERRIREHKRQIHLLQEKIKSEDSKLNSLPEKREKFRMSKLILEKSIEEMGITSSLNPEHISLFKSRVEQVLKEVYPEYQYDVKLKLDPSSILGDLTANDDTVSKRSGGHSCISTVQKFSSGIHTWNVHLTGRKDNGTEDWLMIGVLDRARANDECSFRDKYCYGATVNTTSNNYEYIGSGTMRNKDKFRITNGDKVTVTLNLDTHKLLTQHKNWESIIDLPTDVKEWYPHFNVHSLLFKLNE